MEKSYEKENFFDVDLLEKNYKKRQRNNKSIENKHFIKIFSFLIVLGGLCVGMIMTNVASAQIKCDISSLNREIKIVEGEIQNLSVAIGQQNKSDIIERKAIMQLGMNYPVNEQIIYLNTEIKSNGNFAMLLKGYQNN